MPAFQIQETDGSLSSVSHKEFFEILNDGCGFLYFKRGGKHIALLPTATNEEALRICRQADNAENYTHAMETRCRDEKGRICRYQRDENGVIIRNASGKPVSAKCSDCPRDGWTGGKRENCCIRTSCRTEDCTYCMKHREYYAPISLEWFTEDKYDFGEGDGAGFQIADPDADIQAALERNELNFSLHSAISRLPLDERLVIEAVFMDNLTQRAYAAESGMSKSTVNRLYNRALDNLRTHLSDFY